MWKQILTYRETFESIGEVYDFDTSEDMDNVQSMNYFLCTIQDVPEDYNWIVLDDGTQVILQHPDFDYKVQLDSGGRGDFYSHRIEISKFKE